MLLFIPDCSVLFTSLFGLCTAVLLNARDGDEAAEVDAFFTLADELNGASHLGDLGDSALTDHQFQPLIRIRKGERETDLG